MPRAQAAIQRALQLSPGAGEAHLWLGATLLLYDWKWREAEAEMRRSIELNPEYSLSHAWLAVLLAVRLRFEESLTSIGRALALDPLSLTIQLLAGRCFFWAGRYPEALDYLRALLEVDQRNLLATAWQARVLRRTGLRDEALEVLTRGIENFGRDYRLLGELVVVQSLLGRPAACREVLAELQTNSPDSTYAAVGLAAIGDIDGAIAAMEAAIAGRTGALLFLHINFGDVPAIRNEVRIRGILSSIGLGLPPEPVQARV